MTQKNEFKNVSCKVTYGQEDIRDIIKRLFVRNLNREAGKTVISLKK